MYAQLNYINYQTLRMCYKGGGGTWGGGGGERGQGSVVRLRGARVAEGANEFQRRINQARKSKFNITPEFFSSLDHLVGCWCCTIGLLVAKLTLIAKKHQKCWLMILKDVSVEEKNLILFLKCTSPSKANVLTPPNIPPPIKSTEARSAHSASSLPSRAVN